MLESAPYIGLAFFVLVFLWTLFTASKKPKCVRFKLLSKIKETIFYKHLNQASGIRIKTLFQLVILAKHGFLNLRASTSLRRHPRVVRRAVQDADLWWLQRQALLTDSTAVLSTGGRQTHMGYFLGTTHTYIYNPKALVWWGVDGMRITNVHFHVHHQWKR